MTLPMSRYAHHVSRLQGHIEAGARIVCEAGHIAFEFVKDHPYPHPVIDSAYLVTPSGERPASGPATCPVCGSEKFVLKLADEDVVG